MVKLSIKEEEIDMHKRKHSFNDICQNINIDKNSTQTHDFYQRRVEEFLQFTQCNIDSIDKEVRM